MIYIINGSDVIIIYKYFISRIFRKTKYFEIENNISFALTFS